MMVLWEDGGMTERELGKKVYLDSGTLAPLVKRRQEQDFYLTTGKLLSHHIAVSVCG